MYARGTKSRAGCVGACMSSGDDCTLRGVHAVRLLSRPCKQACCPVWMRCFRVSRRRLALSPRASTASATLCTPASTSSCRRRCPVPQPPQLRRERCWMPPCRVLTARWQRWRSCVLRWRQRRSVELLLRTVLPPSQLSWRPQRSMPVRFYIRRMTVPCGGISPLVAAFRVVLYVIVRSRDGVLMPFACRTRRNASGSHVTLLLLLGGVVDSGGGSAMRVTARRGRHARRCPQRDGVAATGRCGCGERQGGGADGAVRRCRGVASACPRRRRREVRGGGSGDDAARRGQGRARC